MMCTKTIQPGRSQITMWRIRIACWITTAINTHSEYVILIALALQQWLHECASILGYTYTVCLVFLSFFDSFFFMSYFRASPLFPLTRADVCVMTGDVGCTDIQKGMSNSWNHCATFTKVPVIKRACSENMKLNSHNKQLLHGGSMCPVPGTQIKTFKHLRLVLHTKEEIVYTGRQPVE